MRTGRAGQGLAAIAALALAALSSGCATSKTMALSRETKAIEAKEGLALASLRITNVYKPGWQPLAKAVLLKSVGPDATTFSFALGVPYKASPDEGNQFEEFLVSVSLPPGKYELMHVHTSATGFMVFGNGVVPIHAPIALEAGKAVYLGRLEAVRRERTGDEPRAGPVIPLIDQAAAGFSGGTFDVKLVDRYDEDVALMRKQFPALKDVTVEKKLMPPPRAEETPAAEAAATPAAKEP
jgi:hypothetical protein